VSALARTFSTEYLRASSMSCPKSPLSLAARVAHLPLEFFERLPAKEAIKLKGIVVGFLYGGAGDN